MKVKTCLFTSCFNYCQSQHFRCTYYTGHTRLILNKKKKKIVARIKLAYIKKKEKTAPIYNICSVANAGL